MREKSRVCILLCGGECDEGYEKVFRDVVAMETDRYVEMMIDK